MKPTVGRQVHFHSSDTFWHRNLAASPASVDEKKHARGFDGPFAATVVFVHPDGKVNLLICFPSPCYGSSDGGIDEAGLPELRERLTREMGQAFDGALRDLRQDLEGA